MSEIPLATKQADHLRELRSAMPSLWHGSIFNRASDLHTFEPITGLDVSCLNVDYGKRFAGWQRHGQR